ncbi:MAG: hypothetical protein KBE04_08070 [Phycisphaerae bacterium]|nr:hypothetical protein [Phycisphaerae bacterium]
MDTWLRTLALGAVLWAGWAWPRPCSALPPAGSLAAADPAVAPETLASAPAAQRFHELACDLMYGPTLTEGQAEQALILLQAAAALDVTIEVHPLLLELAGRTRRRDYSEQVPAWLNRSVHASADLDACRAGVRYCLERLDSPQQRERFLGTLLEQVGGRNAVFDSELMTLYGNLVLERRDRQTARSLFAKAHEVDPYNRLAFAKVAELAPDQIGPAAYLEHLRLVLRESPLDVEAALAFAQYAEQLELYEVAAGTYGYCVDLFRYFNPGRPVPPEIYLPWAMSLYHTDDRAQVVDIAAQVRQAGRVDLFLEGVAGRAAAKSGDQERAQEILSNAAQKATQLAGKRASGDGPQVLPRHLAWFYCFAQPDKAQALDWANKAFAEEPNSAATGALLAYALVLNGQLQWAQPLIERWSGNQVSGLARAGVLLAQGDKVQAADALRASIAKDPGSLSAEQAREQLAQQGLEYPSKVDPGAILGALTGPFGQTLIPRFTDPNQWVLFQTTVPTNTLAYGDDLVARTVITNRGPEPLVISDQAWMRGNVRVDAKVTGDLTREWKGLISRRLFSDCRVLPGHSAMASLPLTVGPLRDLIRACPQASLKLEFYVHWDPPAEASTRGARMAVAIPPSTLTIARPRFDLTATDLRSRFSALAVADSRQRVETAGLFVGLLKEQHRMATQGVLYNLKFAEWMPGLLKTSLTHDSGLLLHPGPDEWVTQVHSMADLVGLPLDLEISQAVARNLHDPRWPVRLMALVLLAGNDGGFRQVLDWTSKYDVHPLVRDMALAWIGSAGPDTPSQGR